ncbi:2-oxoacid:acceptor oxidoreductase subunit alpha [Rhodohalobacter barkolensis]|uniref:2-oxoacid:acceptor oxidoreductase subunit alpha n=1 Tax=Rhodohalobacter barkolensis TaxID=2053187 RepID=A0A2N0VL92_9BACT|nr:2-oxoacid:acceptor oxidoreductase subunit alpha [Rhodohalobacter barkolensis]PKD44965.1 2-oxoacid:acceptor oxidoreductase subunit alpha [Rhodohalobacter barkolensis]
MANNVLTPTMQKVVVRFSGDSGDGMQLTGDMFSQASGQAGLDLTTIPDFPAEIRAPQGSVGGVSSFQIQFGGTEIYTPGDEVDVLVVMNPAALKANLRFLKLGGTIVADKDSFTSRNLKKADYEENPLEDKSLDEYKVIKAPATSLTKEALKDLGLENQAMTRSKNMFALGLVTYMFGRPLDTLIKFIEKKFSKKPVLVKANKLALEAGFNFALNTEIIGTSIIIPPAKMQKGTYRNIDGNTAIAWGFLAASENSGRKLSLCSYPITPASEILHELSARRDMGAIVFQAEDEIAAVCAAIGASFSGNLSITTTSGPGLSLKSEAIGLAVISEIPLVIVNVQRAGPSTGLPTKTEQSDLNQALYGRHGDAPLVVMAASSPDDCFNYSYEAARLAMEHSTPVILLSDTYLASGTSPWRIPENGDLPDIKIKDFEGSADEWLPYIRDPEFLTRYWKGPGDKGFEHRIGGLEKQVDTGNLTYEPENHEKMTKIREEKIAKIAKKLPRQSVVGAQSGKLLVIGWGSTHGAINTAVTEMLEEGEENIGFTHFNYINPLPENTEEVFSRFDQILVCELNNGQFANYLKTKFPKFNYRKYNKIQGQPFFTSEIKAEIINTLTN